MFIDRLMFMLSIYGNGSWLRHCYCFYLCFDLWVMGLVYGLLFLVSIDRLACGKYINDMMNHGRSRQLYSKHVLNIWAIVCPGNHS